eukprot:gene8239-14181_t
MEPMGFSVAHLDPPSQMLYNSLNFKHMSAEKLSESFHSAGQHLLQNVKGRFFSNKGNMTYTELLQGLIHRDEVILTRDPHLQFTTLVISNREGSEITTKIGGRALITDKRMLFLSSQFAETCSLAQFGDPKKLPGGYTLEMSCKDATYYFPISLENFKSVELDGRSGISGTISIHASKPPCAGCCGMFGGDSYRGAALFVRIGAVHIMPKLSDTRRSTNRSEDHAAISSTFDLHKSDETTSEYNELSVKLGVLLPPWNEPSYITLHLGANAPVPYIRDIISILQQNAPALK